MAFFLRVFLSASHPSNTTRPLIENSSSSPPFSLFHYFLTLLLLLTLPPGAPHSVVVWVLSFSPLCASKGSNHKFRLASKAAPVNQISAMALLLVGVVTTLFTVLVHSLIPPMILKGVRLHLARGRGGIWFWDVILVMNFILLALAAHFVEIALWALSFVLCGEFSNFGPAFYYSATSYTTLGDSNLLLSPRWRLLGPVEAANGMLMFGVSTAIIFGVIHRLIEAKFGVQRDPPPKSG
jgi:hypothetical protein